MEASNLETWEEKPALGLLQSHEDAFKNLSLAIVSAVINRDVHKEQPVEAALRVIKKHFENQEDTDKKLAEAFAELSQLRRTANKERVDGMLAIKALVDNAFKSPEGLAISLSEVKRLHESIEQLIGLNLPRTEEITEEEAPV